MAGFLNSMLSALTTEASIILRRSSGRSALGFWEPVKVKGGDAIWMPPTILAIFAWIDRGSVLV